MSPRWLSKAPVSAMHVFLQLNGQELTATETEAVVTLQLLAGGELEEVTLAEWVQENSRPWRQV
ncbi:MAG: hypothetical protein U5S82_04765 [Gammaproteobacteria bacterium]|nr:hypothetical protein [Gammaproteobacteria bacterium]